MEEKEATRTCRQCHREVAEANFALHETHCRRFLCVCPDCDEAVPKDQLDQHREEQHTQVRCSKCNKKMERRHLIDHESDECVERLQSCQYCELELPWKELDEHHVACGSRTELCRECGRYVTLRDQPGHGLTCSATDDGSGPPQTTSKPPAHNIKEKIRVTCNRCMASFPAEDIDKHELNCAPATRSDDVEDKPEEEEGEDEDYLSERGGALWINSTYKSNSMSDRASNGPWDDGGDPDQISTCPYCHLALPLRTLRWHKGKCRIHVILK
ncbi:XIAP-associated factor 1 BIRC4-binding protein [Larimichthys crocea]|uniref:XIAP-associated factor 1 BIRC4-binding protein n=1 Tax=Larimichthys crocea TaxID=215358 RepID=A0A6G0IVS5_LARCR|nr:XIAP-associated factor 1 [Larimichthys crocea]KAE8295625.1 XIAP-associated factor 1 BIRC4-binding protein [Larimichthys crocea]